MGFSFLRGVLFGLVPLSCWFRREAKKESRSPFRGVRRPEFDTFKWLRAPGDPHKARVRLAESECHGRQGVTVWLVKDPWAGVCSKDRARAMQLKLNGVMLGAKCSSEHLHGPKTPNKILVGTCWDPVLGVRDLMFSDRDANVHLKNSKARGELFHSRLCLIQRGCSGKGKGYLS